MQAMKTNEHNKNKTSLILRLRPPPLLFDDTDRPLKFSDTSFKGGIGVKLTIQGTSIGKTVELLSQLCYLIPL